MLKKCLFISFLSLLMLPLQVFAGAQPYPPIHSDGVTEFLFKPTEGMGATPSGWTLRTDDEYGNSTLAYEALYPTGGASAAIATTTSVTLPSSTYRVYVLVRGTGKARITGTTTWVPFTSAELGKYEWILIGTTATPVTQVAVDVAYDGTMYLYYAGICAEGTSQAINPVSAVWQKIQNDERVVVVMMGDSVTENSRGTGGGSSSFETGNPGLMKTFLEGHTALPVDYIAHREPPTWPNTGDAVEDAKGVPTTNYNGTTYLDGLQDLDESKRFHLINVGTGGADSTYGWSRFRPTIIEEFNLNAYYNKNTLQAEHGTTTVIRNGVEFYQPDLVIVNFGTNDNNGVPPDWTADDYMFHMKVIASNLQLQFGTAVILSTPHKWSEGTFMVNHWEPELVVKLRDYTAQTGYAFSDVFIAYELGQGDGIHPRDMGHGYLAQTYIKAIKGEAQTPASSPTISSNDLTVAGGVVTDTANGIMMMVDPNSLGIVSNETEAIALLAQINTANTQGYNDWRFPTPEELFPMIDQTRRPAVIAGAPFIDLAGYYYHGPVYNWAGTPRTSGFDFTVGVVHSLYTADPVDPAEPQKVGHIFPVRTTTPGLPSPVFTPGAGAVATNTPVVITATSGSIYYTDDGSDPRAGDGSVGSSAILIASGNSVTITQAVTLKARAKLSADWSALSTAAYTIGAVVVPAPVFTPGSGAVTANTPVVITATSGSIYYTDDGSDPRAGDGSVGSSAILIASGNSVTITQAVTLKARAKLSADWSALNTAAYTIEVAVPGDEGSLWGQDDFEDGDYTDADPTLTNGLTWGVISGGPAAVYADNELPVSQRLRLKGTTTIILAKGISSAPTRSILPSPFTAEFFVIPKWYAEDEMGLIFLYQDAQNYYKLEVTLTEVAVHRVLGGVETTIGSSTTLKMPSSLTGAKFSLQVEESLTNRTFTIIKSEKTVFSTPPTVDPGMETVTWSDTDAVALAGFSSGRIGFYQFDEPSIYNSPHYDDVLITTQMLDRDADGLEDGWEIAYLGSISASDGSGDDDGDLFLDGDEFEAGTDPTNSLSRFVISESDMVPGTGTQLKWPSVEGRTYDLYYSTNLLDSGWQPLAAYTNLPANPPTNQLDVLEVDLPDARFLQLRVRR